MTYHEPRNAARYSLTKLNPRRGEDVENCTAGPCAAKLTPEAARYVASSPSFTAKPMCERHAHQWAKRHGIEVPA